MEPTTIGKRIVTLRKSRGMTQDQLAEQLGVTAQAVSKWENDISCPDITLLPKLAAIFQVTTDSLLGMPEQAEPVELSPRPVRQPDREEWQEDDENEKEGFTFHFDLGDRELPWFATSVLVLALSMLLNRTILSSLGRASLWDLMWPSALLAWGVCGLWSKLSLWNTALTCFGFYQLLENMGILHWDIDLPWSILIWVGLIGWAVSTLLSHLRHDKKDGRPGQKTVTACTAADGRVHYDASFGSDRQAVTEDVFRGGLVDLSFGDYTLDLTQCSTVAPGTSLNIDVSFGSVTLLLPKRWRIQSTDSRSFASISTHGDPNADADQLLELHCDISFGSVDIRWT